MENRRFNYAALEYANQWWKTDKELLEKMRVSDRMLLQTHIRELSSKYQVARTFHAKNASDKQRDALWSQVTDSVLKLRNRKSINVINAVESLAESMGAIFDRSPLISAASKFLWFSQHYDVRIYDSRAVRALAPKYGRNIGGDYGAFCAAWNEEFQASKKRLEKSVSSLQNILKWSSIPQKGQIEALDTFALPWFSERVFDKHLWLEGSKNNDAKSLDDTGWD